VYESDGGKFCNFCMKYHIPVRVTKITNMNTAITF
jgi:hypothetical protein